MELGGMVVLLFGVAAAVAIVARILRIPYTVALVAAGGLLGAARVVAVPVLTKDLLFALFLPGLLFEAAYHMEAEDFWRDRFTILSLALPGVAVAVLLTAALLGPALALAGVRIALGWNVAFLFAALIAATDPISVVSLFRTLGAPRRLAVLIEGESLVNDGTAAVFFTVALAFLLNAEPNTAYFAFDAVYQIGGGIIVGGMIGIACAHVITRLDDGMLEITVTTIAAYGSFIAGERLQVSGVIATVTAGLLSGNRETRRGMRPSTRLAVTAFWEYVAFALNSLVFLLIGFQVRLGTLAAAWKPILAAYVVVTMVRSVVIFGFDRLRPGRERLPRGWSTMLVWGGLRGALSMVLALSIPPSVPQRDFLVTLTYGVVALSILLQGLTISPLMSWLGIGNRHQRRADAERARADLSSARAAAEEIDHMREVQGISPGARQELSREYEQRIEAAEAQLGKLGDEGAGVPGALSRARRYLLLVEKDQVLDAFRMGAMSEEVRDRVLLDIDVRWAAAEAEVQELPADGA
jgi:CPA1 family monovalent cation:H+ antiporter